MDKTALGDVRFVPKADSCTAAIQRVTRSPRKAGNVGARTCQAGNESLTDRIIDRRKNDRNGACCLLHRCNDRRAAADDHVRCHVCKHTPVGPVCPPSLQGRLCPSSRGRGTGDAVPQVGGSVRELRHRRGHLLRGGGIAGGDGVQLGDVLLNLAYRGLLLVHGP